MAVKSVRCAALTARGQESIMGHRAAEASANAHVTTPTRAFLDTLNAVHIYSYTETD